MFDVSTMDGNVFLFGFIVGFFAGIFITAVFLLPPRRSPHRQKNKVVNKSSPQKPEGIKQRERTIDDF